MVSVTVCLCIVIILRYSVSTNMKTDTLALIYSRVICTLFPGNNPVSLLSMVIQALADAKVQPVRTLLPCDDSSSGGGDGSSV